MRFIVDSSGWIEFFTGGPLAKKYEKYLKAPGKLVTPTVVLYEVYKKIRKDTNEENALVASSLINTTSVVPLSDSIALLAADMSIIYSLPMADAIVYATALEERCTIVTGDRHFKNLDHVVFIE
jgi:predicted nucleic acid-binding protein